MSQEIQATSPSSPPRVALEGDQLLEAVRSQVEYYFSKENLAQDSYLVGQMDSNKSVALTTVMKFAKLRSLTQDESVVKNALTSSTVVTLVDNRIKANLKAGKGTIILREIPQDTPEAEIREIFNFEGCKPIVSMRSDIGNTWFVVMESEDDAKEALVDLRVKNRKFRGESVKARLKTETLSKSFFSASAAPFYPTAGFPGAMLPPTFPAMGTSSPSNIDSDKHRKSSTSSNNIPLRGSSSSSSSAMPSSSSAPNTASTSSSSNKKSTNKPSKKGGNSSGRGEVSMEMDVANFPPLPSDDSTSVPVPTPGYKGDYLKYSFDDVIHIVKSVRDASIPESIHAEQHGHAMTVSANLDLLQRQRTFSIDETREQLQQGKPVQRLAVGGAVDYGSMMYGDGYSADQQQQQHHQNHNQHHQQQHHHQSQSHENHSASEPQRKAASWAQRIGSAESATGKAYVPPVPKANNAEKKAASQTSANNNNNNNNNSNNNNNNNATKGKDSQNGKKEQSSKKSSEKKSKSSEGTANKEKRSEGREKKEGKKREKREGDADDTSETHNSNNNNGSSGSHGSSWGGKPTFANVLRDKSM